MTAKQVSPTTPAILVDDPKVDALARLLSRRFGTPGSTLVVGCGDGSEAALLGDLWRQVAGMDSVEDFDRSARQRVELRTADAMDLPFAEGSFDLGFSFTRSSTSKSRIGQSLRCAEWYDLMVSS